jgi:FKBP-type peptidyl-prolyl cis-trans isomerase SlyD
MKIDGDKEVTIMYQLFYDGPDGELIEETEKDDPFVFVFKKDRMLDIFEDQLEGMQAGDKFSFGITSEDAYGPYIEKAVVEFSKETFRVDGIIDEEALEVDSFVPMEDEEGNAVEAMVLENNKDTVILDFNHPLAGEDLYFNGYVVAVKPAGQILN